MLLDFLRVPLLGVGCLLIASCTALNPTFESSDATSDGEVSGSAGTLPSSSSGEGSGSSVSDSVSSTSLSSTTESVETSSTGSGTIGSSDSADTGTFIGTTGGCGAGLPDGVQGHCTIDCSVLEQDCPQGEACRAWANDGGTVWNSTRCVPVSSDPGQRGDSCTAEGSGASGIDTCDVGLMCWNVDAETLEGQCISYCSGTPDDPMCEAPDDTCSITNDGVLAICLPECDPLLGDCNGNTVCVPSPAEAFTCVPDDLWPCPAGFIDVEPENVAGCIVGEACCTPYCELGKFAACPPELECAPFFDDPESSDHPYLGVCITAM